MNNIVNSEIIQRIILFSLVFLLFIAILPSSSFRGDMSYWLLWTRGIHEHGLGNIYNIKTEYHPFFLYCLWIFQWILGSMKEVEAHLNYVKIFPLIFDFIGALSVFLVIKNKKNAIIYPFFLLFNVAYLYNTMLWGQVDSIHTAFIILSLIFILKERPLLSLFFFVLALNTKLQAIIYLPIIGLLFLPYFVKSYKILLKALSIILLLQLIILIPFIFANSLGGLWTTLTDVEARHPHISMNAFNFWYYFFDAEVHIARIKDSEMFSLGLSYKVWGRGLFFLFSTVALLPLLKNCFNWIKNKIVPSQQFYEMIFLTGGLITVIFFYFNTQMHERYTHSAIILYFFYAVKSKRYLLYILCSLAYVLNMERVLKVWDFENYKTLIFDPVFISTIYSIIIVISIIRLYLFYIPSRKQEI